MHRSIVMGVASGFILKNSRTYRQVVQHSCAIWVKRWSITLVLFHFVNASFSQAPSNHVKQLFALLPGTWQNTAMNHQEIWEQKDSILKGNGLVMKGSDTLWYERLEINCITQPPAYTSWVDKQNGGNGIQFLLSSSSDSSWIFENPLHDFPQKISYTQKLSNKIEVRISGNDKNRMREETFEFIRK